MSIIDIKSNNIDDFFKIINSQEVNTNTLSKKEFLNYICQKSCVFFNCESCAIFLAGDIDWHDELSQIMPDNLLFEAGYCDKLGFKTTVRHIPYNINPRGGLTSYIVHSAKIFKSHGAILRNHNHSSGKRPDHLTNGSCHSMLGLPLTNRKNKIIGAIKLENKKNNNKEPNDDTEFSNDDIFFAQIISSTIIKILENIRYSNAINQLLDMLNNNGSKNFLESVLDKCIVLTSADNGCIALYNENKNDLIMSVQSKESILNNGDIIPIPSLTRICWQQERIINVSDVTKSQIYYEYDSNTLSEIVVPLRKDGLCIGVLNLESRHKNYFDNYDTNIVKNLAKYATIPYATQSTDNTTNNTAYISDYSNKSLNNTLNEIINAYNYTGGMVYTVDNVNKKLKCICHHDNETPYKYFESFEFNFNDISLACSVYNSKHYKYYPNPHESHEIAPISKRGLITFNIKHDLTVIPIQNDRLQNEVIAILVLWNRENSFPEDNREKIISDVLDSYLIKSIMSNMIAIGSEIMHKNITNQIRDLFSDIQKENTFMYQVEEFSLQKIMNYAQFIHSNTSETDNTETKIISTHKESNKITTKDDLLSKSKLIQYMNSILSGIQMSGFDRVRFHWFDNQTDTYFCLWSREENTKYGHYIGKTISLDKPHAKYIYQRFQSDSKAILFDNGPSNFCGCGPDTDYEKFDKDPDQSWAVIPITYCEDNYNLEDMKHFHGQISVDNHRSKRKISKDNLTYLELFGGLASAVLAYYNAMETISEVRYLLGQSEGFNKAFSNLAWALNHETKNICESLAARISSAIKRNDFEDLRDAKRILSAMTESSSQLIGNVSTYTTEKQISDLAQLMDESLVVMNPLIKLYKINIQNNYEPGYEINVNPLRVIIAITSIIRNCIDQLSNDESGSKIYISIYRSGSFIKAEIEDTGKGFTKESLQNDPKTLLPKAFSDGYTTRVKGDGGRSGTGLWIVQQIMADNGGSVHVTNSTRAGGGGVVMLNFPRWSLTI